METNGEALGNGKGGGHFANASELPNHRDPPAFEMQGTGHIVVEVPAETRHSEVLA